VGCPKAVNKIGFHLYAPTQKEDVITNRCILCNHRGRSENIEKIKQKQNKVARGRPKF